MYKFSLKNTFRAINSTESSSVAILLGSYSLFLEISILMSLGLDVAGFAKSAFCCSISTDRSDIFPLKK